MRPPRQSALDRCPEQSLALRRLRGLALRLRPAEHAALALMAAGIAISVAGNVLVLRNAPH